MNSFNVLNNDSEKMIEEIPTFFNTPDTMARIQAILKTFPIVAFVKGNAQMPQCGFSANTCNILKKLNVSFKTYDILKDPELRQQLKEFSSWPTYPQVYFKEELIGGNDILMELFQNGELQKMLNA